MKKTIIVCLIVAALAIGFMAVAHATMIAHMGNVEGCSERAYKYGLLVRYKDANISPDEVISVIAPNLNLPEGWERRMDAIIQQIYKEDLTESEVFERIYIRCIHGYTT